MMEISLLDKNYKAIEIIGASIDVPVGWADGRFIARDWVKAKFGKEWDYVLISTNCSYTPSKYTKEYYEDGFITKRSKKIC